MIKNPKGKIYVLYSHTDGALRVSSTFKCGTRTRLGVSGAKENGKKIHPELQNKVSSVNYKAENLRWYSTNRNYQFDPPAMKFFDSKYLD